MPHSLTLQINLENFNFFKYKFFSFLLSPAQKNVMQELIKMHEDISKLKKPSLSFTQSNETHIARGSTHAITHTLQEKLERDGKRLNDLHAALEQKNINLNDLHTALALKSNNLDDLLPALKQKNINLDDLATVIKQKEISFDNLKMALERVKISLADLQDAFENYYHIKDKEILSSIISCLVEPIWIPGNLSVLALALLQPTDYYCSNLNGKGPKKSILQVNTKADSNAIEFGLNLYIMDNDNLIEGIAVICYSIEKTIPVQVKLLPITMQFYFLDEQKSKQFQQKLAKNFKSWLLHQNESDHIWIKLNKWGAIQIDFWVLPTLIGLLIGLMAMISFLALNLTPISPLLLPPLGFALGLCLGSVMNTYAQISIKKEQAKFQKPIHLLSKKSTQNPGFFTSFTPIETQSTRQGENQIRNRGTRDKLTLMGEAGNASRHQVLCEMRT